MTLFIFGHIHRAYTEHSAMSNVTYLTSCAILLVYAVTIVFGRLYTGMHSIIDCTAGVALGTGIWVAYVMTWDTLDYWLVSDLMGKR